MTQDSSQRTLRIIGGKWRGRKVSFANSKLSPNTPTLGSQGNPVEIRPTPDRVRETLFNWLAPTIKGSNCLDLFAGSGILSIEALSRGATRVTLVDITANAVNNIVDNIRRLNESDHISKQTFAGIVADAFQWVDSDFKESFDVVFLDPPFSNNNLYALAGRIDSQNLIKPQGLIYIESPKLLDPDLLPENWIIRKQKKAGAVHYGLCEQFL